MLSLGIAKKMIRSEYKQINKKSIYESLITKNIIRQQKYSKLSFDSDLSRNFDQKILVVLALFMIKALNQNSFDASKIIKEYESIMKEIKTELSKIKPGLN